MSKNSHSIHENMIDPSKNSQANLDYYESLENFFKEDPSSLLMKLRSFALYAPRQVLTDFMVRYEIFKMILNVPGSVAEFGVFNGQGLMSFSLLSAILEPNNLSRKIYGFDTFEGFPNLSQEDADGTSPFLEVGGMKIDSYERLKKSIELFDRNRFIGHVSKTELVKGDVLETLDPFLEANPQALFSLIYLDMDLYEPTNCVLQKLYSRVPKGGVVAFDELNMKDYPGETLALLENFDLGKVELRRLPFCSRISYFQK